MILTRFFLLIFLLNTIVFADHNKQEVSLQLLWKHQFQFAGYYIAKEKGFFKEYGLEVTIKEFDKNTNIIDDILNGKSQYAIGRSSLIIEKAKGVDIIALAAIFQSSPLILLSLESSNIKSIQDFENKRITLKRSSGENTSLKAMIKSQGIDFKDMIVQSPSFNINDLITKKTDLISSYISNEPFILKQKNIKYKTFIPKDYNFDFYSDILFTSSSEVKNNAHRAEDFKQASIKGWEYAFSNIEETVELILKKYNTQNKTKEALLYEAEELKKLAFFKTTQLGNIDENKIKRIYDIYHVLGIIKNGFNFNGFIYKTPPINKIHMSKEEQEYLKNKKQINMCIDPDWMPYEKNENSRHVGIAADYIKLIEDKIQIPIKLVNTKSWQETLDYTKKRKCDIISLLMKTKQREKYLDFTNPYLKVPLVFVTNIEEPFIEDIANISGKVGIIKGYAYKEILVSKYPNIKFIEVDNLKEGLRLLSKKKLFGFIDTVATTGYYIQKEYFGKIKIATKIDETLELGIGSRNDEIYLKNIFNKAIDTIDKNQRQKILNKWISVSYEQRTNYILVFKWVIVLALIFSIILFIISKANKELNLEIEKRKKSERKLKRYINIVDKNVITSSTDLEGNITYVSEAFCKISGYTKEKLIGENHSIIRHKDMKEEFYEEMWEELLSNNIWTGEIKNIAKNGKVYWVKATVTPLYNNHRKVGYTAIREDITMKKRLEEVSVTDELTRIYNRRYFNQILPKQINSAKRKDEYICFSIMDIDYFKPYNDTYGHIEGDKVLQQVACQIKESLHRADDYCFRLGGEEFGILFKGDEYLKAEKFVDTIRRKIEELQIEHKKSSVNEYLTASFGLVIKKASLVEDLEDLYKEADDLLYMAKASGKNKVVANKN